MSPRSWRGGFRLRRWALGAAVVLVAALVTPAIGELALYETTQSDDVVARAPHRYEKIPDAFQAPDGPLYIERTAPKMRINDRDIERIVVEARTATATETGTIVAGEPYYAVTFVLRAGAATALNAFLNTAGDQRFGLRFGRATLGVVRPFGPFEGGREFTYHTHSKKVELEHAFSAVKDKVTWR
jgi:hypothetical protein